MEQLFQRQSVVFNCVKFSVKNEPKTKPKQSQAGRLGIFVASPSRILGQFSRFAL
jgi:hypothetical protein